MEECERPWVLEGPPPPPSADHHSPPGKTRRGDQPWGPCKPVQRVGGPLPAFASVELLSGFCPWTRCCGNPTGRLAALGAPGRGREASPSKPALSRGASPLVLSVITAFNGVLSDPARLVLVPQAEESGADGAISSSDRHGDQTQSGWWCRGRLQVEGAAPALRFFPPVFPSLRVNPTRRHHADSSGCAMATLGGPSAAGRVSAFR